MFGTEALFVKAKKAREEKERTPRRQPLLCLSAFLAWWSAKRDTSFSVSWRATMELTPGSLSVGFGPASSWIAGGATVWQTQVNARPRLKDEAGESKGEEGLVKRLRSDRFGRALRST
jgi:hypothetical protein